MTFKLKIEVGNAAMETTADVAEALHAVARKIGDTNQTEGESGRILDYNGNPVGTYAFKGKL